MPNGGPLWRRPAALGLIEIFAIALVVIAVAFGPKVVNAAKSALPHGPEGWPSDISPTAANLEWANQGAQDGRLSGSVSNCDTIAGNAAMLSMTSPGSGPPAGAPVRAYRWGCEHMLDANAGYW